MAADLTRTAADERADAWERLAALERELPNLRAHLLTAEIEPAAAHQAARSARIIAALACSTADHAIRGAQRATDAAAADIAAAPAQGLRSVS